MSKEHADLGDGLSLNSNKIIFHGLKPNSSNFSFFKYSVTYLSKTVFRLLIWSKIDMPVDTK